MKDSLKFINLLKTYVLLRKEILGYPGTPQPDKDYHGDTWAGMADVRLYVLQSAVVAFAPVVADEDSNTFTFPDKSTLSRASIIQADPAFDLSSFYHPNSYRPEYRTAALKVLDAELGILSEADASVSYATHIPAITIGEADDDDDDMLQVSALVDVRFYMDKPTQ